MARRQHTLTTPVSCPMGFTGSPLSCNLVRIYSFQLDPVNKSLVASAQGGCLDGESNWQFGGLSVNKSYRGAAFDTLMDLASAGAGEKYINKIEDKIYQDLVTDGVIGAGTQGDY